MSYSDPASSFALVWLVVVAALILLEGIVSWWVFKAQTLYRWFESKGMTGLPLAFSCYVAWPVSALTADQLEKENDDG